jgi:SAM-dependent methyltransferase
MIAMAKAKGLACQFQVGDAEALPFGDAHFDRVVCNFGLYHLPEPDLAITEAARVLRLEGVYVFTTWCGPEVSPLFRIVGDAIHTHGTMDVGLPPAPPPFRLADRTESTRVMAAGGFGDISFVDVPAVFECKLDEVIVSSKRAQCA